MENEEGRGRKITTSESKEKREKGGRTGRRSRANERKKRKKGGEERVSEKYGKWVDKKRRSEKRR